MEGGEQEKVVEDPNQVSIGQCAQCLLPVGTTARHFLLSGWGNGREVIAPLTNEEVGGGRRLPRSVLKVHFLKVTRVITLAPHEVHPYHSTERRYLPSSRLYRNKVGISCLRPWRLSLVVPHPKTPILNWFYHLLWFDVVIVSPFSCLAKSYPVSRLTPLPQIPNQLHLIQTSAHEDLDANGEARVMPGFT